MLDLLYLVLGLSRRMLDEEVRKEESGQPPLTQGEYHDRFRVCVCVCVFICVCGCKIK